jgi:flavin reductase (DIM6/NTAB) family NADH-FMN oxidoreductase RutF
MIKTPQATFNNITHGVYVISVSSGQQRNAFTAAWVSQVSFDPLLLCFSINPKNHSYQLLKEGNTCCISVLNDKQFEIAKHFGQSKTDKMSAYQWLNTSLGSPALANSLAYFDCRVDHCTEAGDHKVIICQVVNAATINEGTPMLYRDTTDMDKSSQLYKKQ